MFRSFGIRNFRVWFAGALTSNVGTWMQVTTLDWIVLTEFTDHNALAMGAMMAFQFAPALLLVPLTGWVSDRFPRRRTMMLTQGLMGATSLALAILMLSGAANLGVVFAYAALFGVINAFDTPSRQSIVTDLVDEARMSNAVALKSASYNGARLIGPALSGGLILLIGSGWIFALAALSNVLMVLALALIDPSGLPVRGRIRSRGALLAGIRYFGTRSDLILVAGVMFLVGALGLNMPIVTATMAVHFEQNAAGYGLLSSLLGVGSLIGALLAARRRQARLGVIIVGGGLFGVTALVAMAMPTYWSFAISLIAVGATSITMLTTANAYVQTTTEPELRGRVMALYMAINLGATPVGAPLVGLVADAHGPHAALLLASAAGLAACAVGSIWWAVAGNARPRLRRSPIRDLASDDLTDRLGPTSPMRPPEGDAAL